MPQGQGVEKQTASSSLKDLLAQKHFEILEVKTSQSASTEPFKFLKLYTARTTFQQNMVDEGANNIAAHLECVDHL